MVCSFAGGCSYAIEASGLTAALMNPQNYVEVCGSPCALRTDLSDGDFAVCEVPELATSFSAKTYSVTEPAVLYGTVFPANSVLYDNELVTNHIDRRNDCTFGMTFKEGHVGVLDEAKIYLHNIDKLWVYQNNVRLQGSNDNWATSEDIYKYGLNINEGWNTVRFDEEKPAFHSYRFIGRLKDSCRVTEFKLTGVESIADEAAEHTCTPKIKIGGETLTTDVALGVVTYSDVNTPVI